MSDTVAIKEHDRLFDLYDVDGCLVGKANPGKKVMLADAFYVPERTCRMGKVFVYSAYKEHPDECYECTECGYTPDDENPRYCPNCGARAIEEGV